MTTRRKFIQLLTTPAALTVLSDASADATQVDERDPQAVALGYSKDAKLVERNKFAKYESGQACANCQLFQGRPTAAVGPCLLFAGKNVTSAGWCNAYAKRP